MLAPSLQTASALVALALLAAIPARASVEISSAPTMNMNCSAGVCTPTAKDAVLNVNDLVAMLSSADTTVKTGNGAVTIGIVSPLAWASTHRLTLDASLNINIKAQVMVEGAAGLTIVTNDGGTGGDLMFYLGGKIDFLDTNSSLIINGNSYVLANDIQGLASDIAASPNGFFAMADDYDAGPDGTYLRAGILTPFYGAFEGLGHTIANFSLRSRYRTFGAGLFQEVGGLLRDIRLTNVRIEVKQKGPRVFPRWTIGSLVGISVGTIINASTSGSIVAANNYSVGGLVGAAGGSIAKSYSTVHVSSGLHSYAGGLVGLIGKTDIRDSYASGEVSARQHSSTGGLVGAVYTYGTSRGSVETSYSAGLVDNASDAPHGGFIGKSERADFTTDYWDIDTSGQHNACPHRRCPGVTGLTDAQLKSGLPAGFDPKIWAQSPGINNGYPYLITNPPQ